MKNLQNSDMTGQRLQSFWVSWRNTWGAHGWRDRKNNGPTSWGNFGVCFFLWLKTFWWKGFFGAKFLWIFSVEKWTRSCFFYTPVIKHSNGKSTFSIGNTSSKGPFSIAMLDYRRVDSCSLQPLRFMDLKSLMVWRSQNPPIEGQTPPFWRVPADS